MLIREAWRDERPATVVLVATHPVYCCVDKGSLEEKQVGDPVKVLALLSSVLGPRSSHLTSLGLSFLLDEESKFGISSLQDSFVLENSMIFFFFWCVFYGNSGHDMMKLIV